MFERTRTFSNRYPLVGPTLWMLSVQYFITQFVVAQDWPTHYSWLHNTISDLGNTACGNYGGQYVCSPLHDWMNASFIILGASMVAGSSLIYHEFRKNRSSVFGFTSMALAGIGTMLVGIFPENTVHFMHALGAFLPFFVGNLGLVVMGLRLELTRPMKYYTITTGAVALVALGLFYTNNYLHLGIGGMERVVAYPQTIWLIVFGIYISRSHYRQRNA